MQVVIEIDEERYSDVKNQVKNGIDNPLKVIIAEGEPFPTDAIDRVTIKEYLSSYEVAQPKMGQWIIKDGKEQGYDIAGIKTWYIQIMCDKCGFIKTAIEGHTGQYKFCPNCGQPKMQEVKG